MKNVTLCIRTWREVKNFAWHRKTRRDNTKM